MRERYEADRETGAARQRAIRAAFTEEQRERERARLRAMGWHESKRSAAERRRALAAGNAAERFAAREVFERDSYVCGICCEPIDRERRHPDPLSVSLDHVVPISLGGEHTRANTRPAHLDCNVHRGNRDMPAQMLANAAR